MEKISTKQWYESEWFTLWLSLANGEYTNWIENPEYASALPCHFAWDNQPYEAINIGPAPR